MYITRIISDYIRGIRREISRDRNICGHLLRSMGLSGSQTADPLFNTTANPINLEFFGDYSNRRFMIAVGLFELSPIKRDFISIYLNIFKTFA